jgi:hypothetical protein
MSYPVQNMTNLVMFIDMCLAQIGFNATVTRSPAVTCRSKRAERHRQSKTARTGVSRDVRILVAAIPT